MAFDAGLAERVRELLQQRGAAVVEKRMFGGLCFMERGHMVGVVSRDRLIARIAPADRAASLRRPHVAPMVMQGRTAEGFLFVAGEGLADDAELAHWIDGGRSYAATLPPKPAKAPRKPSETHATAAESAAKKAAAKKALAKKAAPKTARRRIER